MPVIVIRVILWLITAGLAVVVFSNISDILLIKSIILRRSVLIGTVVTIVIGFILLAQFELNGWIIGKRDVLVYSTNGEVIASYEDASIYYQTEGAYYIRLSNGEQLTVPKNMTILK